MYVLLPVCFVGETYASPLPLAFLRYSYGGCCSNLRSADVSRVDTVAFVNRLILNVITTLAIELSSYYELLDTLQMYIQHVKYQSELISSMYVHCQIHALPVIQ